MNYNNKSLSALQNRISKVYSQHAGNDRNYLIDHLTYLDNERLEAYHITNFNDLKLTNEISKILEINSEEIYDAQITNLSSSMSEEELRNAIRNLPENIPPDKILVKRIEKSILSQRDYRVPENVTRQDLYLIDYLNTLLHSQINELL